MFQSSENYSTRREDVWALTLSIVEMELGSNYFDAKKYIRCTISKYPLQCHTVLINLIKQKLQEISLKHSLECGSFGFDKFWQAIKKGLAFDENTRASADELANDLSTAVELCSKADDLTAILDLFQTDKNGKAAKIWSSDDFYIANGPRLSQFDFMNIPSSEKQHMVVESQLRNTATKLDEVDEYVSIPFEQADEESSLFYVHDETDAVPYEMNNESPSEKFEVHLVNNSERNTIEQNRHSDNEPLSFKENPEGHSDILEALAEQYRDPMRGNLQGTHSQ